MSRFDTYFMMNETEVVEYVKEKTELFGKDAHLQATEIGDGNLNFVYRVRDIDDGRSIIVKQSGVTLRRTGAPLSPDRNKLEAEILIMEGEMVPGVVPKVYLFDTTMCCLVMEDIGDHENLRLALCRHETFPRLAEDITDFMVETMLPTTDIVMDHQKKKELVKKFINPELCAITERAVYTTPYKDTTEKNKVEPGLVDFVQNVITNDERLHLEVAKCLFDFMNDAQALIHGDLHTGSIFVRKDSTKVLDPEFAFYGPMGYDVGNVIANLMFAWCNARITMPDDAHRAQFLEWVEDTIAQVIDLFKEKFRKRFDELVTDRMAKTPGFCEWYLDSVLESTAAVSGIECIRRIAGNSEVVDITSIKDEEQRLLVQKICLLYAKEAIMTRTDLRNGQDYRDLIARATAPLLH